MSTIHINNEIYTLVCGNRFSGRAVYRGLAAYLRIGLSTIIEREVTIHRYLLAQGFPVAALLQTGTQDGQPFFIEAALGDAVWGDILEAETHTHGVVTAPTFQNLLTVVLQWAEVQLQNIAPSGVTADLSTTVRLTDAEHCLPEYITLTRQAFERLHQRLVVFPTVLTHGDFHPYNLCGNGVIDLEFVHWSIAGYDVITGLFDQGLLPSDPTDYHYAPYQLAVAHTKIDELFQRYHLPLPSLYIEDFRLCRMMRTVQLAERRPPDVQQWIHQQYIQMATAYLR